MKNYLSIFLLFFSFNSFSTEKSNLSIQDSLSVERYKTHINTLQYISRDNYNNEYFLELALQYVDSIRLIDENNIHATLTEKNIDLTKNTIDNNVISKIEFFDFYSGLPAYYGFVDDAIEYAYDNSLTELLKTKYKVLGNVPLSETNVTSILIRDDCDDETFEIINQSLISNTNHRILQQPELIKILGLENSNNLINGLLDKNNVAKILEELNLDRLGVFTVNNLDIIDDKIWFVKTDFKTFEKSEGFLESIFARGYTVDKRDLPILIELFLVLVLAIIFVSLTYGITLIFDNRKNILFASGESNKELVLSVLNKVKYVALYFITPLILSFLMIYICSFIIPNGDVDIGEINVNVWIFSLTILMSFLPILIN